MSFDTQQPERNKRVELYHQQQDNITDIITRLPGNLDLLEKLQHSMVGNSLLTPEIKRLQAKAIADIKVLKLAGIDYADVISRFKQAELKASVQKAAATNREEEKKSPDPVVQLGDFVNEDKPVIDYKAAYEKLTRSLYDGYMHRIDKKAEDEEEKMQPITYSYSGSNYVLNNQQRDTVITSLNHIFSDLGIRLEKTGQQPNAPLVVKKLDRFTGGSIDSALSRLEQVKVKNGNTTRSFMAEKKNEIVTVLKRAK